MTRAPATWIATWVALLLALGHTDALAGQQPATTRNQIANASFEESLKGWGQREPRRIAIDETIATKGRQSIRLDGSGSTGLFVNASQDLKLKPGTNYVLRCDIKRSRLSSGNISVDVIERETKDSDWVYHRCGDRPGRTGKNAWGHYELRFRTGDKLYDAMLMLYNINSGAVVWYDNIELTEDDGSEEERGEQRAQTALRFELQTRDAAALLLVNGQRVEAKLGEPLLATIREGVSIIGIDARAEGANPGVRLRLLGHPEIDGRWRASAQVAPAWVGRDFDDRTWSMASCDAGGFLWADKKSAPRVLLRQQILWNEGHDGPDRCVNPLVREWGISEGSAETLFLALYSHFPYPLDDYEFLLDVPRGFRLLDIMHQEGRNVLNLRPTRVATQQLTRDGRPYTRYRIAEPKAHVRSDRIGGLILPLLLEKWTGTQKTTAWYYQRVAKGNFTELEQKIPVRVLPPVNGRLSKGIFLSQYCAVPWDYCRLSPEHLDQHLKQSFQAGFNTWVLSPCDIQENLYLKTIHDRVLEAGGRIILWSNYPYFGLKQGGREYGYPWLQETPAARARYFDESGTWEQRGQYCPSYVLGEGRERFLREVKAAYRKTLAGLPGASIIWSDWEEAAWISAGAPYNTPRDGLGSWCFCDRCKSEFRKWANLSADVDLADANIFRSYRRLWDAFRTELDGRLAAVNRQAANELGKPYMVYSWTAHRKYWESLKGRIDMAFPGCPGNGPADGYQQKHLDETAAFLRDQTGLDRWKIMGQRFSFFYYYQIKQPKEFWQKWQVTSPSGYVEPKTWKSQILRVAASLGMGMDLQSSLECSAGMLYWIGEATRIVATYEDLFHRGERDDALAACDKLEYPHVLVLRRGSERLVLLFNEEDRPLAVTLHNKSLKPGQAAEVFGTAIRTSEAAEMKLTIPDGDVAVVHIR